ncbi:MAG: T9SS type A sorting domain-containing protein, partial [candidate division KSB1 bacterium]|nr:T9SS type A sorting domain-containing protein [candidate division KSB1 bacterium]
TLIPFALPQAGQMRLAVYNILGQPVRTLMEGVRPAGEFQVTWDGRDNRGRQVASGVYFYRLEAQGQVQTRKLTLMR